MVSLFRSRSPPRPCRLKKRRVRSPWLPRRRRPAETVSPRVRRSTPRLVCTAGPCSARGRCAPVPRDGDHSSRQARRQCPSCRVRRIVRPARKGVERNRGALRRDTRLDFQRRNKQPKSTPEILSVVIFPCLLHPSEPHSIQKRAKRTSQASLSIAAQARRLCARMPLISLSLGTAAVCFHLAHARRYHAPPSEGLRTARE
jgi:hypothetical protein